VPEFSVFMGRAGSVRAVTNDRTGAKLPSRPGGWVYEKQVTIEPGRAPRIGADGDRVLANVAQDGFHMWSES
jgi:hypothetical protein